jgi:uncharacterized protein (TIGR03086 family)
MTMYSIDDLGRALSNTQRLIRGVRDDQWTAATPCAEWDLRALVNHATWVVQMFGASAGSQTPPARDADLLGDDAAGAFDRAAATALAAWRARGLEGEVELPRFTVPAPVALGINILDAYIHGWDIAQSTGQDAQLDAALCGDLLEFMPGVVPPSPRDGNFGPVIELSAGAPAPDRLLAYSGRKP